MAFGDTSTTKKTDSAAPAGSIDPTEINPSLTLNDAKADDFLQANPCDIGETVTATVQLKVTAKRDDQFGKSISFDVIALEGTPAGGSEVPAAPAKPTVPAKPPVPGSAPVAPADDEDDLEEAPEPAPDEEKVLGYKRPASKKKAPKLSAKDLED